MSAQVVMRPIRSDDTDAVWGLLERGASETVGMTSLPESRAGADELCLESARTLTELATGEFELPEGERAHMLFGAFDAVSGALLGTSGLTFKNAIPNLGVQVTTSLDGLGLTMRSISAPWTRTELNAIYLGPDGRGRGLGSLISRGRFMFLHLVRSQIPTTIASHLRGRIDDEGLAPFWHSFGAHFVPWSNSTDAEAALAADPSLLDDLADLVLPLTAPDLDSLGLVHASSLPAFRILMKEGLRSNGMYDPIDGGPTVVRDLADTMSSSARVHGPVALTPDGEIDSLIATPSVARFAVVRSGIDIDPAGTIGLDPSKASALGIGAGDLVSALPLATCVGKDGARR